MRRDRGTAPGAPTVVPFAFEAPNHLMEARRLSATVREAFQLSLRIRHPSMDPADISRSLDIQAEHSFRAGDTRASRSGIASVHTETYWLGLLPPSGAFPNIAFPGDARSQLAQKGLEASIGSLSWALSLRGSRFLKLHADFLRRIRSEGAQVSLLVTISTREESSFILPPEASKAFGDSGVTIEFELGAD